MGSPFMQSLLAALAEGLTDAAPVGAKVLGWRGDPTGMADALLDSAPQTNDVPRSIALIAAGHWLTARLGPGSRPLATARVDFHGRWLRWTAPPP